MTDFPGNAEPQLGKHDEGAELGLSAPRWYSRGYLPHLDDKQKVQSITFRLADSLPREKLEVLDEKLKLMPNNHCDLEKRRQIEEWLDSGIGCCALRHPRVAGMVQDTLLKFDGDRYRLVAWCIMPNHLHVVIEPSIPLGKIVQSWKSYTGRWAMERNAKLGLGVLGKRFWMREYWDRFIRNENHLKSVIDYIHNNPVSAGLCKSPELWLWSSAHPGNAEPQLGRR